MTYRSAKTGLYVTTAVGLADPNHHIMETDRPSAARRVRAYEEAIAAAKDKFSNFKGSGPNERNWQDGAQTVIFYIEDSVKEACGD